MKSVPGGTAKVVVVSVVVVVFIAVVVGVPER